MRSDWQGVKLADVSLKVDYGYTASANLDADGPLFLRITDIVGGSVDWSSVPRCEISEDNWAKYRLDLGDIVVARTGASSGEAYRLRSPRDVVFASYLVRFKLEPEKADSAFVGYVLRSSLWWNHVRDSIGGSAQPQLNAKVMGHFELPLPPLDEQRRIAGVLGALDDKIEHNEVLSGRLREALTAAVDRVLDTCDSSRTVYEYASVTYGAAFKSSQFGDEGQPLLRIRDLATHNPGVKTTEDHPKARIITAGDIVVGMDGEFRAHLWHGPDSLLNQRACAFDPLLGVSRAFVWRGIQAPLGFVEATESGTTVIHLGKADIDEFEIPAPSPAEMQQLIEDIDPLVALSVRLGRQSQRLAELRNVLLPKLVSGAIRIPDSYDPDNALATVGEAAGAEPA